MKIIKLLSLLILILFQNIVCAQLLSDITNKYAINAFKKAVTKFTNKSNTRDLLLTIEIKSIDSIQGEFSVKAFGCRSGYSPKNDKEDDTVPYIHGFLDIETFNRYYPTYYFIKVLGRIVFVQSTNLNNINFEKYGINRVTQETLDSIVKYYRFKGWNSALDISNALKMRYIYKGYKIQYDPFALGWTPYLGREYWTDWKLKLGNNQEKLKQDKLKSLISFSERKGLDLIVCDSLERIIKNNHNLTASIKSQNTKELKFKYLYEGYLKYDKSYNDTTSIYPFIFVPESTFPYKVIISKNNNYWGELIFKDGLINFRHVSSLNQNEKEIALNTFKYIKDRKKQLLFYMYAFGNRIWSIEGDKILVFQGNKKYRLIEADEFIHRFYYEGDIIIERMK